MADPSKATHKAILAGLQSACSCSVYDAVPQDTTYPYVVMDYFISQNDDFLDSRFDDRTYYLSIWSRAHGQAEVMDIIQEIETLHETPFSLDTGQLASFKVVRKRTARNSDNLTFRGQVVIKVLTHH